MNKMNESFKIDFVGIGAAKSGTTWLGHMLEHHPQLCMSVPKEVHYFNDLLTYRNTIMDRNYAKGIRWYEKHFTHCAKGRIIGEITPRYSIDPLVPARIKEHNRDIKLFYCLRNPVDQIESHYNFAKYFLGKEERSMDQAVREEPEYMQTSVYFRNLSRFLEHFPREQFFIIWFEDIRERPEALLKEIYTFLGVDTGFIPATIHEKSNPGRINKSPKIHNLIHKMVHRMIGYGFLNVIIKLKKAGVGKFISNLNSKPLKKDKMTPSLKEYIIDNLRDDIHQLEKWANKDLSHWLR
jgi:sulfotransferase family protein